MRRASTLYLLVGCLAIAAYFVAGRHSALGHIVLYDSIGASAVIAIVVGVRRHRPERARAWLTLAAGQGLFVVGDVVRTTYDLAHAEIRVPSPADAVCLAAYPLITWGVVALARGGDRRRSLAALFDASLIAVAAGLVIWPATLDPIVHEPDGTALAHVVSILYPGLDIVLAGAAVRLFLGGSRGLATTLLLASMTSLLVADLMEVTPAASGGHGLGAATDGLSLLAYVLIGVAAPSPSMANAQPPPPFPSG